MKKLLFLASMLLVGMVPSMAQEKMSEEKALMQQYYDLLFQKKDTVKADKALRTTYCRRETLETTRRGV